MTGPDPGATDALERRALNPRRLALGVAAALALAMAFDSPPQNWLRVHLFDAYQQLMPRVRVSAPAVVVEIDEASLAEYGQWPWPRSRLAELVGAVAARRPAAIGVDIILPEPDRLSPRRLAETLPGLDPALRAQIAQLPGNDARLADALRGKPVVVGMAGEWARPSGAVRPLSVAPIRWRSDRAGADLSKPAPELESFDSAVRSIEEIESAAAGIGLLNNPEPTSRVVRRPLLLGRVGGIPVPAISLELLRVAAGLPWIDADLAGNRLRGLRLGDLRVPADPDGRLWLRYGRFDPSRYVSARDLLEGRVRAEELESKLALLAVTGLGLLDLQTTPLGEQVFGIEVHLQIIENIFDGSWLVRPAWAGWAEVAAFLLLALVTIALFTSRAHRWALPAALALLAALAGLALLAFNGGRLLDLATPAVALAAVYGTLLFSSLSEARRQRRDLARRLQQQREEAARLAGELDAARRVQMGMLPDSPDVRAGEMRMEIKAYMEPAKTVGGDLYDFFMLDDQTLFVLIGDVSGKGLPAAIFMALVKSLCKSAALRRTRGLAGALADAESEIIRENPELMFVTLTALTLDLDTGEVEYCNAGHDPPYSVLDGRAGHRRLGEGGGPPLCVIPGFDYQSGKYRMEPREMLCLLTDGVTDATNPNGEMYGRERLENALEGIASEDPATVVGTLRQVLSMFTNGSEPADDQTVVVLRWNGPGTSGLIRP